MKKFQTLQLKAVFLGDNTTTVPVIVTNTSIFIRVHVGTCAKL